MRIWEENGRVFFRCERAMSGEGIYKVWIRGDSGELLLGTLAPEMGHLVLGRAIWQMELCRSGCWPVRGVRCRVVIPFGTQQTDGWHWEDDPVRYVDKETAFIGEWQRMLVRRIEGGTELAMPWYRDEPIPLSALFCLAYTERIKGELCLVWKFDEQGRPQSEDAEAR